MATWLTPGLVRINRREETFRILPPAHQERYGIRRISAVKHNTSCNSGCRWSNDHVASEQG